MMPRSRLLLALSILVVACMLCAAPLYGRYIDWPSLGGAEAVRGYLPDQYPVSDAHHYTYRNFMDTWELYRFTTSPEAVSYLANILNLEPPVPVQEFPLIISRPPPYWWHPELLPQAELYSSHERASDGRNYNLLYAPGNGIAYLIRFDG